MYRTWQTPWTTTVICRTLRAGLLPGAAATLRALSLREVFQTPRSRCFLLAAVFLLLPQLPVTAAEAPNERFPCKIQLFGPRLDFELRFFTGFRITAPAEPLAGPARYFVLRVLVTPLDDPGAKPSLLERTFQAGPIPALRRRNIQLRDSFAVGSGRYNVAWALIDTNGPSCYLEHEIKAELRKKDRGIKLSVEPGEVVNSRLRMFRRERAILGSSEKAPLRVKVFLNLDVPRTRSRTRIRMWELMPRISALRALSRHPRIGGLSLVAYSVEDQAVIVRHGVENAFDYSALQQNIDDLAPGFVSIEQLQEHSDLSFFNQMLIDELPGDEEVDAYIFLGPDVITHKNREKELLESIGPLSTPFFSLVDGHSRWKGLIGKTVGFFDGKTFRFYDPSQMADGIENLVVELDKAE